MSEIPEDGEDRDDERNDAEERENEPFGIQIGGRIGKLLEFLDEQATHERGVPSRSRPGRIGIEYDISAKTGPDRSDRRRSSRSRVRRTRTPSSEYLATVREDDGDVVITADLPGVDRSDLTIGVAEDVFVVRVAGEEVARVPVLEGTVGEIDATFNNFVLDVRIPGDVVDGVPGEVVNG